RPCPHPASSAGFLTLPRLKPVGFLLRRGPVPSGVIRPLHKRLQSPCAPRRLIGHVRIVSASSIAQLGSRKKGRRRSVPLDIKVLPDSSTPMLGGQARLKP